MKQNVLPYEMKEFGGICENENYVDSNFLAKLALVKAFVLLYDTCV